MPILKGRKSIIESYPVQENQPSSTFKETFDAALGQVIDEEWSISSSLNKEGESQRATLVREKAKAGEIDINQYRSANGAVDYNRIAETLEDPAIKTNAQLREERNEILAQRRRYAQDVIERGSGTAQFLGGLNGYVLDPINLATLGIAAPVTTVRAGSIVGRAMLTARNTALVEGAAELGIQALVYQHKKDIDSPYSATDALANIGMAATGAAILGGVQGGISGWLEKLIQRSNELPETNEILAAREYLVRAKETVDKAPSAIDEEEIKATILAEARAELLPAAGNKLSRGEVKELEFEKKDLEFKIASVREPTTDDVRRNLGTLKSRDKKAKARKQKKQAQELARGEFSEEVQMLQERLDIVSRRLDSASRAAAAEAELSRIDQGIIPERVQKTIDTVISEQKVVSDIEFLEKLNREAEIHDRPTKTAEMYETTARPDVEPPSRTPATTSQREREVLTRQGIADEYDADIAQFKELDSPVVRVDDEEIDAAELINQYDQEIKGLDDVLRCVYG